VIRRRRDPDGTAEVVLVKPTGRHTYHDDEIQEVRWFRIDGAVRKASHRNERDLILKARTLLDDARPGGSS
jgi:hypothetical protein